MKPTRNIMPHTPIRRRVKATQLQQTGMTRIPWIWLFLLLLACAGFEMLVDSKKGMESQPFFDIIFPIFACVAAIFLANVVGLILQRPDTERDEEI